MKKHLFGKLGIAILVSVGVGFVAVNLLKSKPPEVAGDLPRAEKIDQNKSEVVSKFSGLEMGEAYLVKAGCLACHETNVMRVGPSYASIAEFYSDADPETLENLAQKILDGGAGQWGVVPMISNPQLDVETARDMVRWILQQEEQE